ncbi:hypothetical protein U9M48_002303 [Paspalum notatum var. saurae]|uniref:Uncharacterized protein n=1 Tax=Paspalum notatum var. saurae TaxID=547442 RepID=A0AAQ3SDE9_PASNO
MVLDLSMNSLSGHLPSNVGYINTLSLFSNRITGGFPRSICKGFQPRSAKPGKQQPCTVKTV